MNDDLILELGGFCTELLGSEAFKALTQLYSQQCAADILKTKPSDKDDRERKYLSYLGFEDFLALARHFADTYAKINEQHTAVESTTDDDDPRVHDIYNGMN